MLSKSGQRRTVKRAGRAHDWAIQGKGGNKRISIFPVVRRGSFEFDTGRTATAQPPVSHYGWQVKQGASPTVFEDASLIRLLE